VRCCFGIRVEMPRMMPGKAGMILEVYVPKRHLVGIADPEHLRIGGVIERCWIVNGVYSLLD